MEEFRLTNPVVHIDELRKDSHIPKSGGLANMGYFILNAVQKSMIEEVLECIISVTMDLMSYAVELNHILVYMLDVCHRQAAELMGL